MILHFHCVDKFYNIIKMIKTHFYLCLQLETPRLGEDQLHDLIDQCVTSLSHMSMSRTSLHSDSRFSFADTESITGGNMSADENTPRYRLKGKAKIFGLAVFKAVYP